MECPIWPLILLSTGFYVQGTRVSANIALRAESGYSPLVLVFSEKTWEPFDRVWMTQVPNYLQLS
jgi:hypothetical protein